MKIMTIKHSEPFADSVKNYSMTDEEALTINKFLSLSIDGSCTENYLLEDSDIEITFIDVDKNVEPF